MRKKPKKPHWFNASHLLVHMAYFGFGSNLQGIKTMQKEFEGLLETHDRLTKKMVKDPMALALDEALPVKALLQWIDQYAISLDTHETMSKELACHIARLFGLYALCTIKEGHREQFMQALLEDLSDAVKFSSAALDKLPPTDGVRYAG